MTVLNDQFIAGGALSLGSWEVADGIWVDICGGDGKRVVAGRFTGSFISEPVRGLNSSTWKSQIVANAL
jgi:hypothetical protein